MACGSVDAADLDLLTDKELVKRRTLVYEYVVNVYTCMTLCSRIVRLRWAALPCSSLGYFDFFKVGWRTQLDISGSNPKPCFRYWNPSIATNECDGMHPVL